MKDIDTLIKDLEGINEETLQYWENEFEDFLKRLGYDPFLKEFEVIRKTHCQGKYCAKINRSGYSAVFNLHKQKLTLFAERIKSTSKFVIFAEKNFPKIYNIFNAGLKIFRKIKKV